jgi:hypothetical protein
MLIEQKLTKNKGCIEVFLKHIYQYESEVYMSASEFAFQPVLGGIRAC